jgi:hypothetical protein
MATTWIASFARLQVSAQTSSIRGLGLRSSARNNAPHNHI